MQPHQLQNRIQVLGLVPVIAIEHPQHALPLADALLAGGLPIVEITFRTTAAAAVIHLLTSERPDLLVGAGTILTHDNLIAAQGAGARFAMAPGLNPDIVARAADLGLWFIPGVATPSEVERALVLGCRAVKLFPAEQLGGLAMVNALAGPYGQTGLKFLPTGGVSPANLESYLANPVVAAVGGSWLAKKDDLVAGCWQEITQRCRASLELVRRARGLTK